jgi:hypothetical protein
MKILGFGHRKNVGKDTAVRFLSQELRLLKPGCNILVAGFADKVKDIAYQLYSWAGLQPKHYYDKNYAEKEVPFPKLQFLFPNGTAPTPRAIWIHIGNSIRTEGFDWTWAEYLFNQPKVDFLFINDLRFPTEAEYIVNHGGWLYRIDRPDQPKVTDGADEPLEGYDKWKGILLNDQGIKEYHATVMTLLPSILE